AEGRLFDAAVLGARDHVQLLLDRLGQFARFFQVCALSQVPENEIEILVRTRGTWSRRRARLVFLAGDFLSELVGGLQRQVIGLRSLRAGETRRVRVNRKKQVCFLMIGDRSAVV